MASNRIWERCLALSGQGSLMPRVANPQLTARLLTGALRILDEQGMEAVSMRSVASAAGVTTGAIYERFADRDALMMGVVGLVQKDLLAAFQPSRSVEDMAKRFIGYYCRYPHRFALSLLLFDARLASGAPMPVYEMLKTLLTREIDVDVRIREHIGLALTSLTFGTIRSMIAAGPDSARGKQLRRSALIAIRLLIAAFPRKHDLNLRERT